MLEGNCILGNVRFSFPFSRMRCIGLYEVLQIARLRVMPRNVVGSNVCAVTVT